MGPETSVRVFERSASQQQVGGQVGLMAPAFNALTCLDPSKGLSKAVTDAGVQRKIFRMLDEKNNIVMENQIEEHVQQAVIPWLYNTYGN